MRKRYLARTLVPASLSFLGELILLLNVQSLSDSSIQFAAAFFSVQEVIQIEWLRVGK